ncbi:MAG: 4Fe-4S binding protein, partial [Atribacterota bacterium]|nr:4Fe-4S binding protein [Atribacterota bacterium]
YERDKCIGCRLCVRVCPSRAIEFIPDEKKIKIRIDRCIFCSQCNDICPVNCLHMSEDFLLANEDRLSPEMIVK